jgi:ABC-2 type transport system permease protein
MRYLRLYGAFWRNSIRQAVEFRANFFANLFANFGWMMSLLVFLEIIYRNTQSVAGWTKPMMLVLFGTYSAMRGVSNMLFYNNLSQLPNFIRTGTMDFILTKPVNSLFYTSLRYIGLDDLGQTIGGLVIVGYGSLILPTQHSASAATIAAFALMMVCSLVLFYSITLLMMTLSFWLVRLDNLMVLGDTVFSMARTPIEIFRQLGPGAYYLLTYVLPLAFIAALPVKALFGAPGTWPVLGEAILLAGLFFAGSSAFWRYATRAYSSASS